MDELLSPGEDLAKGWLLALLERAPLSEALQIVSAELIGEAPRVCEAFVRALADDRELQRIAFLVSQTGTLAGGHRDTGEALRAIDALQGAIWSGVREALGPEDAERVLAVEGAGLWRFGDAVRSVLRHGDVMARETDARVDHRARDRALRR